MYFKSISGKDYNKFDEIIEDFVKCLQKDFSMKSFVVTCSTPDFCNNNEKSVIYFKSSAHESMNHSDEVLGFIGNNNFNNEINITVNGMEGKKFRVTFHIISEIIVDDKTISRIKSIGNDVFSRCLNNRISNMRDQIVSMSFISRDLNSFLYRSIVDVLKNYIKFEGASVFYHDYVSNSIILSATTGITKIQRKIIKRSDVKYYQSSRSFTRMCFENDESIYEQSKPKCFLPENTFGEDVVGVFNRINCPIRLRPKIERIVKETSQYNRNKSNNGGKIGAIRIVNFRKNKIISPLSSIDFHLLSYFCEYISVLANRYIKTLNVSHDQERSTHGFITDLSTIKLQTQLFIRKLEEQLRLVSGESGSLSRTKLSLIESEIDIFKKNILSIQDSMSFQLHNVLEHSENMTGAQFQNSDEITEKPFVEVFRRVMDAKEIMSKTYNRNAVLFTFNGSSDFDSAFINMPALAAPRKTIHLALRNLVENSIKYTPKKEKPKIDFKWGVLNGFFWMDVADNGIGINVDEAENLFSEGFRSRQAMRLSTRGNGLGLCVSKQGLVAFRGDLEYRGTGINGNGSTFRIKVMSR